MNGQKLATIVLSWLALGLALPAGAVDVTGTSARLGWTAASGPVSSYGVFLSRNGAAFPSTPNQVVTTPEITVSGALGDTLVLKVAAYDGSGTKGPESATSEILDFVAAPGDPPPPPPPPPVDPALTVSTTSLNVSVAQGQNATPQSFTVRNTGGGTLTYLIAYSHDWIVLGANSGSATTETDTIPVSFATSTLPAGNYAGVLTIVQTGTPTTEKYVSLNLTVSAAAPPPAAIGVSTTSLTASAQKGQSPAAQSFTVRNAGGGTLSYAVSENASWLSVAPGSGTSTGESDTITLSFATTSLAAGSHSAAVTVSGTGVSSTTIPVSLTINEAPAAIGVSTTSLSASAQKGQSPAAQSFTVRNAGGGTLSYAVSENASWLSVAPGSGTSTGESDTITLSFATTSLAAGSHSAAITVSGTGVSSTTIPVSLTINEAPAAIGVAPAALTASVAQGGSPAAQSFTVRNTGGGSLSFAVSENAAWLSVAPSTGTSTGEADTVTVSFATSSLARGSHTANLNVSGTGVASVTVPVTVTVTDAPASIALAPTTLAVSVERGKNPADASFTIRNAGGGTLSYYGIDDSNWFSLASPNGTSAGETDTLGIRFDTATLAAGSYTGTVTMGSSSGGIPTASVVVSLTVTEPVPVISLNKTSLAPSATEGQDAASTTFRVRNTGGGTLSYAIATDVPWIALGPASGSSTGENDTISVTFDTDAVAPGSHAGTITVSGGAGVAPKTLPVSLTVTDAAASIALSTAALTASVQRGQDAPAQSFTVTNAGGGTLSYAISDTASWLSVSPASGTSTGESDPIALAFDTDALAAGTHNATISVSGGSGVSARSVTVSLTVTDLPAQIGLSTAALSASVEKGEDAPAAGFTVRNAGGGTLSYSVSDDAAWLSVSPAFGTSTGESDAVGVSYDTSGLDAGTYDATITVGGGAGVTPTALAVTVTVSEQPATLEVSTSALSATVEEGQSPAAASFTVRNGGGGTLSYGASESASWLSLSPASGTSTGESDTITLTYATTSLDAGSYSTTVTVSGGSGVAPRSVVVSLTVNEKAPELTLSTGVIASAAQRGQDAPAGGFTVRNTGGGTLSYTVSEGTSWLSVTPAAGTSTGESDAITVLFSTSALPAGTHAASLTVAGTGVAARTVNVSVTIASGPGVLEVSTTTLEASGTPGKNVASTTFTVRNAGDGALSWSATSDKTWATLSPAGGSSSGESDTVQLSFATGSLGAGTHTATLTIASTGLPSKTIAVSLRLGSTAARSDIDGDGRSDALFRHADGSLTAWLLSGTTVRSTVTPSGMGSYWKLVATGDFDGDGKSLDVLWQDPTSGQVVESLYDGAAQKSLSPIGTPMRSWQVAGVGDLDADGRTDVVWVDPASGNVTVWLVNRFQVKANQVVGGMGADWKVVGVGDVDGDRKADVVFERAWTLEHQVWLMDGVTVRASYAPVSPGGFPWEAAAAGDFDGDGRLDLVASYAGISFGILASDGSGFAATAFLGFFTSPTNTITSAGDHDGDGREDLLWYDASSGAVEVWIVGDGAFSAMSPVGALNPSWKAVAANGTRP